ncbi:MAG: hypothetical protein FWC17_06015 [Treponema sp.]|nr:hypothetical protein [Treponema sp.]
MGVIKTALEIALEKTEKVKSDKSSVSQYEARQKGVRIANAFLSGGIDIADELKKTSAQDRESAKQGIFDVLVSQIALPVGKDGLEKLEKLGKGLSAVIKSGEFSAMYKQLLQICNQYTDESENYENMIQQQYAPNLRKKEEELSRRLGREVRIDPLQDPEYIAFYNQHMGALKGNYEPVVQQAREEAKRMFAGN